MHHKALVIFLASLEVETTFQKEMGIQGQCHPTQNATKNPPPRNSRGPLRLGMKNSHETNGPTAQRPVMPSCKAATKPNGTEAIAAARRSCKVSFRTGGTKNVGEIKSLHLGKLKNK